MPHWDRFANRNTFWAALFMEELVRNGVRTVCISPGSRSTPLTLAAVHQQGLEPYLALDERAGAFFALGHAKASGRPVALICTSGTAAVNYHPAVVEAHLGGTPLIVLTADRPPFLREVGEGQTIDQQKLYGDSVRWFHDVGEPVMRDKDLRSLKTLAARAVTLACRAPSGPVHLNFPFRKPLEAQPVPSDVPEALRTALAASERPDGQAFGALHTAPTPPAPETVRMLADRIRATPKGLILCGPMELPAREDALHAGNAVHWQRAAARLAKACSYPILAEAPSGLLHGPHDSSHIVVHSEALLRHEGFRKGSAPDLVLRFGGMPTPKQIELLLDEHPGCPVVLVDAHGRWREPTHHPTELVAADSALFCDALADALEGSAAGGAPSSSSTWVERFRVADRLAAETIARSFTAPGPEGLNDEWFEGRVLAELGALLPEGALLCTASSMPVRDLAYFSPLREATLHHQVNRGANGIDGTLASALGAAAALAPEGRPTVLVTGDLAFLHDASALHIARTHTLPLTIVLLNNDGGGIFEMLPVAGYGEDYERYFGTPQGIDFAAFCAGHGIDHQLPADWNAFRTALTEGVKRTGTHVIEVRTQRGRNREQHGAVWEAVARRLDESARM